MTHMERVGIRALQQNAAAVVSKAAAGEIIEITDRGRPVAQLIPMAGGRLAALIAAGAARPRRRSLDSSDKPIAHRPGTPTLGALLAEARNSER